MSLFIKFFRNFSSNAFTTIFSSDVKREVFVGRWIVPNPNQNTNIVINRIIDRNNEDHCGVCINDDKQKITIDKKNIEDEENYYRAYFM